MIGDLRPRPNEAHLTDQYIEQLGQFVDAGFTDEASKGCFSWVLIRCPRSFLRAVHPHAAEFEHWKDLTVPSNALLDEKHRAGAAELYADGSDKHQRRHQNQPCRRQQDIAQPLKRRIEKIVQRRRVQIDQLGTSDHIDGRICRNIVVILGNNFRAEAVPICGIDHGAHPAFLIDRQCDHQLIDISAL